MNKFIYYRVRVSIRIPKYKPMDILGIVVADAGTDREEVKNKVVSNIISDVSKKIDVSNAKITSSIRHEDINFIMFANKPKEEVKDGNEGS